MIKVDTRILQEAHARMGTVALGMNERLSLLRSALQQWEWRDPDRQAYAEHQQKWDKALDSLNAVLEQIGAVVDTASVSYLDTEAGNSRLWG